MSLGLLARQPLTWNSEAASYILQVEAADGQSLELGVARAINQFVIDCKVRGIWGAIKSSCLLSGARTLNGALRPLKGTAPTNFNFTNSDYNRETGLKGDGTSKYLNTNISAVSQPVGQNNLHFSILISSINSTNASRSYIADAGRNMYRTNSSSSAQFNINASFGSSGGDATMVSSTGFCGLSRNNSQNFTIRISGRNRIDNSVSVSADGLLAGTETFRIFGRNGNGIMGEFSDGRISFYSIGESIDLRLLEQCVTSLRQNFLRAISTYSISDTDAANYVRRVELADGFILENAVKIAIDNLVIGLKADGLWPSIKACCILSGAKTLEGALVPLVGKNPQSFVFTQDRYNRSLGLTGINNGFTWIDSKRLDSEDPQDNHHMCVYKTSSSLFANVFMGTPNVNGQSFLGVRGQLGTALMSSSRLVLNGAFDSLGLNGVGNNLTGLARNNSSSYEVIGNNTTGTVTAASMSPTNGTIAVFARPGGGINSSTENRFSFYSIGEYLNLSLLDARLDTFMAALSNAGI